MKSLQESILDPDFDVGDNVATYSVAARLCDKITKVNYNRSGRIDVNGKAPQIGDVVLCLAHVDGGRNAIPWVDRDNITIAVVDWIDKDGFVYLKHPADALKTGIGKKRTKAELKIHCRINTYSANFVILDKKTLLALSALIK
jgi:hypothetical protein